MSEMLVAKQGHGDSLCGIYALLNVIAHFEGKFASKNERHREIFQHLMLASERCGYLDYHHIVCGYEAFELIEIANFLAEKFGYAIEAILLENQTSKRISHRKVIAKAIEDKKAVIVWHRKPNHWIAVVEDGEVLDSWPDNNLVDSKDATKSDYGLIITHIPRD